MLKIGDSAPQFCLRDQNENSVCLDNFLKQWVVVYFYPKDNTPGCSIQASDFTNAISDFKHLNSTVLGISPDSVDSHVKFIKNKNLRITLLSDEDKEVSKKYGVYRMKKNFGKEYMGIVRTTYIINPKGNIAYIWRNVRVKGHIEVIKKKLDSLIEKFNV